MAEGMNKVPVWGLHEEGEVRISTCPPYPSNFILFNILTADVINNGPIYLSHNKYCYISRVVSIHLASKSLLLTAE